MHQISDVLWTMYCRIESNNSLCTPTKVRKGGEVTYRVTSDRTFPWHCFSGQFLRALFGVYGAVLQLFTFAGLSSSAKVGYRKTHSFHLDHPRGQLTHRSISITLILKTSAPALVHELEKFEKKIRPYAACWDMTPQH